MNLKKLVSGLLLSTALAAGVGVSIASQKSSAKEVKATTSSAVTTGDAIYYIAKNGWNSVNAYFFNGYSDSWAGSAMTKVGTLSGYNLFSINLPGPAKQVIFSQNGNNQTADLWLTAEGKNAFWSDSGDDYLASIVCKVVKKELIGSTEGTTLGTEYIDGTSWTVPKQAYKANYSADGWYKSDKTTKVTNTYSGCDWETTVYSKYTSHAAWTGTIHVDLRDTWYDAAANYAVLFMDKTTYTSEVTGWSTYTMGTAANVKLVNISYSLPFEPKEMTLVRYNSTYSQASWNSQKWPTDGNKWGQTPDLSVNEVVRVGTTVEDGKNLAYLGYPKVVLWNPTAADVSLGTVKLNGSNHAEYYSTSVTLAANQEFKVQIAPYESGDYYGNYTTHSSLKTSFSGGGSSNIVCKTAGTYAFYFDSTNNSTYITKVELAEADEWSQYFLNNVGCDATGKNVPFGWSSCATEYAKLSGAAKNIVYGATANPSGSYIEQAVARYDQALRSHPSLSHFIVNSGNTPRSAAINILPSLSIQQSGTTIVIIAISAVSLAAVGGYFLFRKKKEN